MKKSIKRLTTLVLLMLLMISIGYSQTTVSNNKKDTTSANVCFTIDQAKFLQKSYYKLQECDTLLDICEEQRSDCDSALNSEKKANADLLIVIKNNKDAFKIYDYAITGWSNKYKDSQKEVRRQKTYKWISIVATGLVTGYLGYYVISHPK